MAQALHSRRDRTKRVTIARKKANRCTGCGRPKRRTKKEIENNKTNFRCDRCLKLNKKLQKQRGQYWKKIE